MQSYGAEELDASLLQIALTGFLPADDPRAVVMVAVDSPRGNIYGGAVAAPAFAEIAQMLVRALSIPPDRPTPGHG